MDLRDTLSAELPPPREDEPPSLRQDILDELADHLGCAYHRELLRGANPVEARLRVLNQFGDPAAVARRLWLDAMKGKIMAQRILVATCLVVTLASLALVGILSQQSIRAQRDSARMAVEAQNNQRDMLKQLREMSEAIRTTRSLDWNPVRFQLTEDTPDGPPAVGFLIALTERVGQGEVEREPTQRVTDGSGVADFGLVHTGDYWFQIVKEWEGTSMGMTHAQPLHIVPGSQINVPIVCPKTPAELVPVRVRFDWPADLEKKKLSLYATFTFNPFERSGVSWTLSDQRTIKPPSGPARFRGLFVGQRRSAMRSVLWRPDSTPAQGLPMKQPYIWKTPDVPVKGLWAELHADDLREIKEPEGTLKWERGTYHLSGLLVLRPIESGDLKAGARRFDVLAASDPAQTGVRNGTYFVRDSPPPTDAVGGPRAKRSPFRQGPNFEDLGQIADRRRGGRGRGQDAPGPEGESDLVIPWEAWPKTVENLEARPAQVNQWMIPLPDELIRVVREKLKAAKS